LIKWFDKLNAAGKLGTTQQHFRFNLLPYLGGAELIKELRTTNATSGGCQDSNCTTCMGSFPSQEKLADHLASVHDSVPKRHRSRYESLDVCFMKFTDAIMDQLPKDKHDGAFLVPNTNSSFAQARSIFKQLFDYPGDVDQFINCKDSPHPPGDANMWKWVNVCDDNAAVRSGFKDKDFAVYCYVASFVQKMALELTVCPALGYCRKTEQHVRLHLTPYLGGNLTTQAIKTDDPSNPKCTACYQDNTGCALHQQMWIDKPCCYNTDLNIGGVPPGKCPEDIMDFRKQRDIFFEMTKSGEVDYVALTNHIMENLPKAGMWLVPPKAPDDPASMTIKIVQSFLKKSKFGANQDETQAFI